ncbi:MAG: DNA polymerase/3'-5' exonuclease PolX [Desulfobacterales bacterium]
MPVQNKDVADMLKKMGDLLDIKGDNPFRVRAYRNAARMISSLPQDLSEMVEQGADLTRLSGIGKDLAVKITEILATGKLPQLEKLEKSMRPELLELLKINTLGPKRIKALYRELGIADLADLERAAREEKIREINGFGEKTEKTILKVLQAAPGPQPLTKFIDAEQRARPLCRHLSAARGVKDIVIAGSFRRRKETVGDLDILVTCEDGTEVMSRFKGYEDVQTVLAWGKTKSSVVLRCGLQVDLRVVPEVVYGAALHYFTGSKAHNIAVRTKAVKKRLKINEYGVFRGNERVAGRTEEEVYAAVGLPYIEPELREDQGEIQAAGKSRLPRLVTLADMKGDLHAHTNRTDGRATLEEMASAAAALGYNYLAVTEHSKRVSVAGGLDEKELARQMDEIDRLNEKLSRIRLLKSIEVDILKNGDLDLPDDILKQLDLTVCSAHYYRNLSREKQTDRIIRAMDNPCFNILAHPTGRIINERSPLELDMEKILIAAKQRNCILEINAHPDRLDLTDRYCRAAKEMGVKMAIATDAHCEEDLNLMRYGVYQARRGWLEAGDVVNTRSLEDLMCVIRRI